LRKAGRQPAGADMTTGEISDLPLLERIQKYRDMAAEARRKSAATSTSFVRESYLVIAEHWEVLAVEAEFRIGGGDS